MKTLKLLIKTSFFNKINDFLCFDITKYIFDRRSNKVFISYIIKINTFNNCSVYVMACMTRTDDDDPSKPLQSSRLTHLQERLLKKLGPNAYPFYFEVSLFD